MLTGKGWFIWQVSRCEHGSASAIADKAAAAGLSHVLIKMVDRTYAYGINLLGKDLVAPVAAALKARGIQVWGWHYVYGERPVDEARAAIRRANQLQLDGYVIDAEGEYTQPGMAAAAHTFMANLKAGLPAEMPVALSSYRFPSLHPQLPWAAFLEHCDLNMPQVYWQGAHNSAVQLSRSLAENSNPKLVGTPRPVVPTGSAYGAGDWIATADDLQKFLAAAQQAKLPAANFYSWDNAAVPDNDDLWNAAATYDWQASASDLANDQLIQRFFAALNAADLAELGRVYAQNAAHVTAERTLFGVRTIVAWYQALLATRLPGAVFTITSLTGTGNSRTAEWTAISPRGQVHDGDDTFGILNGHIIYHAAHFTVTQAAPALQA
jgi:ketosteroid isomerase-like protein